MKAIKVAAGILLQGDGRVLISERLGDDRFSGLWEFPGGKLRDGESAEDALHRELLEELGIEIEQVEHFEQLEHVYPDRAVAIDFFLVRNWSPEPIGLEGQGIAWQRAVELDEGRLLPADAPIVRSLKRFQESVIR